MLLQASCSAQAILPVGHTVAKRSVHRLPYLHYKVEEGIRPVLSKKAAVFHYKHVHGDHLKRLNAIIAGTPQDDKSLEEIIMSSRAQSDDAAIYNHAASSYNHTFMWLSMIPEGRKPSAWMLNQLQLHFGGYERFRSQWIHHCTSVFGQGWVWLIDNDGHLEIVTAYNAGNPVGRRGVSPLLLIDLWEHAYVMDYGTNAEQYVKNWLYAANWDFAESMLRKVERSKHVSPSIGDMLTKVEE